jgi:hypothetical protein
MANKHREEFVKSEAQALRLLEEAGFTEPDFVLREERLLVIVGEDGKMALPN